MGKKTMLVTPMLKQDYKDVAEILRAFARRIKLNRILLDVLPKDRRMSLRIIENMMRYRCLHLAKRFATRARRM